MIDFLQNFTTIKRAIIKQKPLLHHITNYVTAANCADIALAVGASPVMADAVEEMPAMTGSAAALVLNLGTVNKERFTAMLVAAAVARAKNIPVILDPVGVMATPMRLAMAKKILADGITIVRGNYAEAQALLGQRGLGQGVDSLEKKVYSGEVAKALAQKFQCIAVVTGVEDAFSDGRQVVLAENGTPLLSKITGAGCMTTTLIAAAAAVTPDFLAAAVFGVTTMNVAAEQVEAGKYCQGPGSFKTGIFDAVYALTGDIMATCWRGEVK